MDLMEELTVGPRATHCCPSGRQYSFAPTTLIGYRRAQTSKVIGSKRLARGPEETPHSEADPLREGGMVHPARSACCIFRSDVWNVYIEEIGRASCRERVCQYV